MWTKMLGHRDTKNADNYERTSRIQTYNTYNIRFIFILKGT